MRTSHVSSTGTIARNVIARPVYTGNVGQRVEGHRAGIERDPDGLGRGRADQRFVCTCSCGWTASAERARLIERLRHRHLTQMVESGARVVSSLQP